MQLADWFDFMFPPRNIRCPGIMPRRVGAAAAAYTSSVARSPLVSSQALRSDARFLASSMSISLRVASPSSTVSDSVDLVIKRAPRFGGGAGQYERRRGAPWCSRRKVSPPVTCYEDNYSSVVQNVKDKFALDVKLCEAGAMTSTNTGLREQKKQENMD